jgi:Raf kinase inhibitor-like YbhB/YbcL family protein
LARLLVLVALVGVLAGCDLGTTTPPATTTPILGSYEPSIPLTSAAFVNEQPIPQKYSCDGANLSPPLQWGDTLPDVKSFALIMDDPDTSDTYVHWVVYDLPPTARSLSEGIRPDLEIEGGGKQGSNGSEVMGYGGPCPPGGTHRYHFKLYALSSTVDLPIGASKIELEQAMKDKVLAYGELFGTYTRE